MFSESYSEKNSGFWNKKNIVTITMRILIYIAVFYFLINIYLYIYPPDKYKVEFDLTNSIALLAVIFATAGTLYSNYQNNIRNQQQIDAAEERLEKQLEEQSKNLNTQIKESNQNFKEQLRHNEEQLKKQLRFDREMKVMLNTYEIFRQNSKAIDMEDFLQTKGGSKTNHQETICTFLKSNMDDIYYYYYLPENVRNKIEDLFKYIKNEEQVRNSIKHKHPEGYSKNISTHLKGIFEVLKENLKH